MLTFFRKHAQIITISIVLFFGLTMFAGTVFLGGIGGSEGGSKTQINVNEQIAMIGEKPLDQTRYYSFLSEGFDYFRQNPANSLNPSTIEQLKFSAFNRTLQHQIMLGAAKEANIKVKKVEYKQALQSALMKFNIKDVKALKSLLKQNNIEYKAFKNDLEDDIRTQKWAKDLQGQVTVTDKDVEDSFKRVKINSILIIADPQRPETHEAAEAQIKDAQAALEAGKSFEAVKTQYTQETLNSKTKWIGLGETLPVFEAQAYSLEKGEVSEVFKSAIGYHIIKVEDIKILPKEEGFDPEKKKEELLNLKKRIVVNQFLQNALLATPVKIIEPSLKAIKAKVEGDWDLALFAYQSLASQNTNDPGVHFLMATVYLQKKDIKNAISQLEIADIKGGLTPRLDLPLYHVELAKLYKQTKQYTKKREQLDKALTLAKDDYYRLNRLKRMVEDMGGERRALAKINKQLDKLKKEAQKRAEQAAKELETSDLPEAK